MDRKGITAITIAVIILGVWWYFNKQEMDKVAAQRAQQQAAAAEVAEAAKKAEAQKAVPAISTTATPAAPAEPATPEQLETLNSVSVDYTFTTRGGGISRALLKKHEAERGTRMTLNEFGGMAIGAISESAGQLANVAFKSTVDRDSGAITFEGTDARQLRIIKKFTVPKSDAIDKDYIVGMEVTFKNDGSQPVVMPAYFVHTGSAAPVHQRDQPMYTGFKWANGKFINVDWFVDTDGFFKKRQTTFAATHEGIAWGAVSNQYFTTVIAVQVEGDLQDAANAAKQRASSVWAERCTISDEAWKETSHSSEGNAAPRYGIEGAIGMPGCTIAPGETITRSFRIYAGPREYGRLRLLPDGEEDVLAFSDVPGIFSFMGPFIGLCSKTLLYSLNSLHAFTKSYAVAIIILTMIIKALLWPMQNKATKSMKRMQALQPKMTEIREKYQDDPTRMNTEVMKLYKDYGVNPLSGCLPALVQMPIFFGFYNMLGKAVELRNSQFLWVHDLSQPDTLFMLPGLGFPVNVLPLCMAATMVWQMMASPKTGDPTQQKVMMVMPLIFVMFCYNYASALALYLTVNNLVSVVQLYATRNQPMPTLQKRKK